MAVLVIGIWQLSCDESDVLPPGDSTLSLTADPATATDLPDQKVILRARVANSLGGSLPGQTVRFSTSEGTLNPPAQTAIKTDATGIATCELSWPTGARTTTAEATSGAATDSVSIDVVPGNFGVLLLNANRTTFEDCAEVLLITAEALDDIGVGIQGLGLKFVMRESGGGTDSVLSHTFKPSQGITDSGGKLESSLRFDAQNDCIEKCSPANRDPDFCDAELVVSSLSGSFESVPLPISINLK